MDKIKTSLIPMKAIFIVGTNHEGYQIRPQCGPEDGADAFKQHVLQTARTHAVQTIAEEMSWEPLRGRRTVCHEVAKEEHLAHIMCDPTSSERQALGISKENTPLDNEKREKEWLRRVKMQSCRYPVLFVCGANHVFSLSRLCQDEGLVPTIVNYDFEAPEIPLERRII
jgi:hypothetical protein